MRYLTNVVFLALVAGYLGLFAGVGFSQARQLTREELASFQKKLGDYDFLTVDFSQEIFKSLRKKTVLSQGQAYFARPGRFRWQLISPSKSEWIFDGQALFSYRPDEKEATLFKAEGGTGREIRQITDMVMNFDALLNRYDIKEASLSGDQVLISLIPKVNGEIIKAEIEWNLKAQFVQLVRLHFVDRNMTTLRFSNPRRMVVEPAFFTIPKDTKLTELR